MYTSLHDLDQILQEKLNGKQAQPKESPGASNPLYITMDEVHALLKRGSKEEAKGRIERLKTLGDLFHLDEFEKNALLIILAPEIDPKYQRIYAYIQNDLNKKYPTISLVAFLLCANNDRIPSILPYFLEGFPLQKFSLITFIDAPKETSFICQALKIEDSVRNFILGFYTLDCRILSFCSLIPPVEENPKIPTESQKFINEILKALKEKQRFLLNFHGPLVLQKRRVALELATLLNYGVLAVNISLALQLFQPLDVEKLFRLLFREAKLSGSLLFLEKFDAFLNHENSALFETQFFSALEEFSWLTFAVSKSLWRPKHLPQNNLFATVNFPYPEYSESVIHWQGNLHAIDKNLAKHTSSGLAQLFKFTDEDIVEVSQILRAKKFTGQALNSQIIYDVCRQRVSADLNHLAQNVRKTYQLEDIVLQEEQIQQLKNILSSYRNQAKVFEEWGFKKNFLAQGITSLFTGPPGTGKTMAATIMANDLGLDLYRIDLSRVVSKYIGETEKNLAKIFEAAEGSGVILFFDEADALFGKRSEVRDAHDRHANIEVSYLLQRIEEYGGPVILASNFRRNIDEAFIRRIHFIVEFPFPDETMREQIWRKVFPKKTPLDDKIDFPFLAKKFKLSGANIRNVALFSAFFSADKTGKRPKIGMPEIIQGVKSELQKIGKSYNPTDFGPYWI